MPETLPALQDIQNSGFSGFAEVVFLDLGANGAALPHLPMRRRSFDEVCLRDRYSPTGEDSQSFPDISGSPIIGPQSEDGRSGIKPGHPHLNGGWVCSVLSILIHHWWGSGQALHKSGSVSKRGCGLRRPLGRMQAGVPPVRRFSQWRRCPSSAGGLPPWGPPRPTSMRVPGLVSLIAALAPAWITDCKLRRNRRFLRLAHGIQ